MKRISLIFMAALILVLALAGCQQQPVTVEGSERDAIVAQAEPIADTMMEGIASGDYGLFSQDFDDAMAQGMPAESFEDLRAQVQEKLGEYQSREVNEVQSVGDYNAVIYNLVFSNALAVTMRLVLTKDAQPKVSGLWFDAPELRE